jgi:hypothetical protein
MSFYRLVAGFRKFQQVQMTLDAPNWWDPVPNEPGWYLIRTNTPIEVLAALPEPPQGTRIYDIPDRVQFNTWLLQEDLSIRPTPEDPSYIVYSGEQASLRNRAREHTHGNHGTGCLCLSHYHELHQYQWVFLFVTCDAVRPGVNGDKAFRVLGEQTWRALNGWPVLCKE